MKTLIYIFLISFILHSCISGKRTREETCIYDIDCDSESYCNELGICEYYKTCLHTSECKDKENCISGKCMKKPCIRSEECGKDEVCDNDFKCLYIPPKNTGEDCLDYGDLECKSNHCIADEKRFFCTKNCTQNNECPENMICEEFSEEFLCVFKDSVSGDGNGRELSDCSIHGQSDCMDIFSCISNINGRNESKCLKKCDSDYECSKGLKCKNYENEKYCTPVSNKKTGELCNNIGNLECKDLNDTCIKLTENERFCTRKCLNNDECPLNTVCQNFGEENYCVTNTHSQLGESCKNSGSLECREGLICDKTYFNGPVCTDYCNNDSNCPEYNSCDITYDNRKLCRPAPNGKGERNSDIGESCKEHGGSDCKEDLLCLMSYHGDEKAYCTKYCSNDDDCPSKFHCADTFKNSFKICVKGEKGTLGANCYNERCNDNLFCYITRPKDYTAFCTKKCENISQECEAEGFYCNKISENLNICLPKPNESTGNIGDKCGQCNDGLLCIYDPQGNFCSLRCNEEAPCPEGFTCENYDENNKFCYPAE